jgi:hypothetical protein
MRLQTRPVARRVRIGSTQLVKHQYYSPPGHPAVTLLEQPGSGINIIGIIAYRANVQILLHPVSCAPIRKFAPSALVTDY